MNGDPHRRYFIESYAYSMEIVDSEYLLWKNSQQCSALAFMLRKMFSVHQS